MKRGNLVLVACLLLTGSTMGVFAANIKSTDYTYQITEEVVSDQGNLTNLLPIPEAVKTYLASNGLSSGVLDMSYSQWPGDAKAKLAKIMTSGSDDFVPAHPFLNILYPSVEKELATADAASGTIVIGNHIWFVSKQKDLPVSSSSDSSSS
jgi:hypothetical protein